MDNGTATARYASMSDAVSRPNVMSAKPVVLVVINTPISNPNHFKCIRRVVSLDLRPLSTKAGAPDDTIARIATRTSRFSPTEGKV